MKKLRNTALKRVGKYIMIDLENFSIKCYFCGKELKGTETVFVYRNYPRILYFCGNSCFLNYVNTNKTLAADNVDNAIVSRFEADGRIH